MNFISFKNKSYHKFDYLSDFENILIEAQKEFKEPKNLNVDILFVTALEMKKLNNEYRGKNYTTDILSFPLDATKELDFLDSVMLGQIIISPWKIKKQAKEFGHSLKREFCYIFAHGIAHLFGFDHQTEEEAEIMNNHVENIMKRLNIGR
ncbi:putative rRNA maturation factor [Metamycoplasma subdolum]|uniref:Endoribonuclease YbeY n=1 Tax=Metamycoplasma subdolum TaxID=92407 RepID=A0A3L9ZYR5_9BACT|nr:rRNA maturation RNase YbeY [Metamycoplasma subdolum]RMA77586.1 putative rRNA maturation factor [Metamycoplasma subdolum]WPB50380.1 rRNA maturation RNase YbeY [Metamycoplasma subdolum]